MCTGTNVSLPVTTLGVMTTLPRKSLFGGLAQLARAPALQAGGQRFESVILHMIIRAYIWELIRMRSLTLMDKTK